MTPRIIYKEGFQPKAKNYKNTLKYGSFEHIMLFTECWKNLHKPYPSFVYPSCWVCSELVFMDEYQSKWKTHR